jgi:hypothetical protein
MRQPSPEMLLSLPILQRSIGWRTHAGRFTTVVSINPPELPVHACRPRQGIAAAAVDRAVVTAENKRATSGKDVLKGQPVIIADLQHSAIEPILQVKVVAEGYLQGAQIADKTNGWRKKLLVADRGRIIYEDSIG